MALLDLQGMKIESDELAGHGGGSDISVTGCGGVSGLSLLACE